MRSHWHTAWYWEIPQLLFNQGSKHDHTPQAIGSNGQQRCSSYITVATMHNVVCSSVQHVHIM